ncbi:hypothetical protein E2C01_076573 [Portunus trituberculatus]|uniref:Uncharacterized protein n=1 Tax=Portunus trituberculatus TaxID=210409 RepID=A0A5B7IDK0_PORTR|nr:hypothetical protein [Portunus trituberculatus]
MGGTGTACVCGGAWKGEECVYRGFVFR